MIPAMRVSDKGQVTIPKELRDELGIGAGSEIDSERADDSIVLLDVLTEDLALVTSDAARYRTYFPTVRLTVPDGFPIRSTTSECGPQRRLSAALVGLASRLP